MEAFFVALLQMKNQGLERLIDFFAQGCTHRL